MVELGRCNCEARVDVHRIVSCEVQLEPKKRCYFALKTHTKEILTPVQINRMSELDFTETEEEENSLSYEDRRSLSKVNKGIRQRCHGHMRCLNRSSKNRLCCLTKGSRPETSQQTERKAQV